MKKLLFIKIYAIFFSLLIIAISIGLFMQWNVLADYEKTIPTNLISPIVNDINNKKYDILIDTFDLKLS